MLKRIITSVVGLPIVIVIGYLGGVILQVSLLILVVLGLTEFYEAMSNKRMSVHYIGYVYALLYYLILGNISDSSYFFVLTLAMILSILTYMVFLYEKTSIYDVMVTLFGFFYVAFTISFIYLVREHVWGEYFIWLIFISAFGSDIFAYFTGRFCGKRKLAPKLSPKKTVEGFIGGLIGAGVLATVYGLLVSKFFVIEGFNIIVYFIVVGVLGAGFSVAGDLSASAIKRLVNIKDFGKLFPGHGGVLDRFDSIIFTAPVVYITMKLLFWNS